MVVAPLCGKVRARETGEFTQGARWELVDMNTALLLGTAVVIVLAVIASLWGRRATPLKKAIAQSIEIHNVAPIVEAMRELKFVDSASTWHKTLGSLWLVYERELDAKLLIEAASMHTSDVIVTWTQRIVEVEPEHALKWLGREFILEKLQLPDDAIPVAPPRKGQRATKKPKKK